MLVLTVDLLDRRRRLLTDHIDALREATRLTQMRHPFTIDAMVLLHGFIKKTQKTPDTDRDLALKRMKEIT